MNLKFGVFLPGFWEKISIGNRSYIKELFLIVQCITGAVWNTDLLQKKHKFTEFIITAEKFKLKL